MDSPSGPQTSNDHEQSANHYPRPNASDIDWESLSDDWRTGHPDSPEIRAAVVSSTRAVWARAT